MYICIHKNKIKFKFMEKQQFGRWERGFWCLYVWCLNKKGDLRLPINVILMYIYKHQGQHYTSTKRTFIWIEREFELFMCMCVCKDSFYIYSFLLCDGFYCLNSGWFCLFSEGWCCGILDVLLYSKLKGIHRKIKFLCDK